MRPPAPPRRRYPLALGLLAIGLTGAAPVQRLPKMKRGKQSVLLARGQRPVSAQESTATLSGRLLYEDQRLVGQHRRRLDVHGRQGRGRHARDDHHQRFLGAYHMVIDVYERDGALGLGKDCTPLEWVAQAVVQPDGTFSVEVPAGDPCRGDYGGYPRYVVRARAGYCDDDLCFDVGRRRATPYALWFGTRQPYTFKDGGYDTGTLLFSPERRPALNDWSRAANHYASLVDSVVTWHVENPVPFKTAEYGGVTIRFPSPYANGRATSHDLIDANNEGWPKGNLIFHEYGHIVHRRAWGGDYAGFHTPIQRWNARGPSAEEPFISFKEGFASFALRYATGRCFREPYDLNHNLPSLERKEGGINFPANHHKALCDWVDDRVDVRGAPGAGDVIHTELISIWRALDAVDEKKVGHSGHDPVMDGFDFCDLTATWLELERSPDRVGEAEHARSVWELSSLLAHNDIACPNIPHPDELITYDLALTLPEAAAPILPSRPERLTQQLVITNLHEYIPSPPVRVDVGQGAGSPVGAVEVPALAPGADYLINLYLPETAAALELNAQVNDDTDRDADPSNNTLTWEVPPLPEW